MSQGRGGARGERGAKIRHRPRRDGLSPTMAAGAYVVPGERAVRELVEVAPKRVREVWLVRAREDLVAILDRAGISWRLAGEDALAHAAQGVDARGVLALAEPPPTRTLDDLLELPRPEGYRHILVALDSVVDPQNLGAILRSAAFLGARGVFWQVRGSAPLSPAAIRAAAGASEHLPWACVPNLAQALASCKAAHSWVVGTAPGAVQTLRGAAATLPDRVVLVMGSEGKGMRPLIARSCDFVLQIEPGPSAHGSETIASLNVSAAAAIMLAALGPMR